MGDSPVNFIFVLLLGSCSQDQGPGKILVFRDYFLVFVSGNNQLLLSLKQDIIRYTTDRNTLSTLGLRGFFPLFYFYQKSRITNCINKQTW